MALNTVDTSSVENDRRCRDAFDTLKDILLGVDNHNIDAAAIEAYISIKQGVTLTLAALGSFACNVSAANDIVTVSVAGTPSRSTFYAISRSRLRNYGENLTIEYSHQNDTIMFRLWFDGIRFAVTYHQVSKDMVDQLWNDQSIPQDILPTVKKFFVSCLRTIKLVEVLRDDERARVCFSRLRLWTRRRGLQSSTFGFLTEDSLLDLSAIVIERLNQSMGEDWDSHAFFVELSKLYDSPGINLSISEVIKAPRLSQETMCGLLVTRELRSVVVSEEPSVAGFVDFIESYKRFLEVDVSYWGLSNVKGGRLVAEIERVIANYIKRLDIRLFPKLKLRAWPYGLVANDSQKTKLTVDTEHETRYLVGTEYDSEVPENIISSIPALLWDEINRNEYFDPNLAYVDVLWVEEIDPKAFGEDTKDWGPLREERKPGSHDEDENEDESSDSASGPASAQVAKFHTKNDTSLINTELERGLRTPLRPALDVLNRIKNDRSFDSSDYTIGYLDRHSGMKEMPAEWWIQKEETAEDFIPQSRIRYFKRISSGIIVWDREARLDLVFGSGRKVQEA